MRVLFASTAGEGHFAPMVPLAKACLAAGHEVLVAAPESFARVVTAAGLPHAAFADVPGEDLGPVMGRLPSMSFVEANRTVVQRVFADLNARAALPGMTEVLADWQPDLVVREQAEFASLIATLAARVPHVQVTIGMRLVAEVMLADLEEPLLALDALAGLDAGASWEALLQTPEITFVPAALDDVDLAGRDQALAGFGRVPGRRTGPTWRFRDGGPVATSGPMSPAWGDPEQPLVYVTFGSVTGSLGPFGGIYPAALKALADQPCRVLMTTGSGFDRDVLPPLPGNARVESWWPQSDVLPATSVLVGHGGFGTTMGALAAGVPQVVVPLFALDQLVNAVHVAAVGAGVLLPEWARAGDQLAEAVATVLSDPEYRRSAQEIAASIGALPTIATAVLMLEEVVGGGA